MSHVFKYPLKVTDEQEVVMPEGAAVLCVQIQRGIPCIWAEVDPQARKIKRTFVTYGTGHSIPKDGEKHYVGTYQSGNGDLVFHVFTDQKEIPI